MTIGEKIKSLRIKANLTQEELAAAADTTKQTIHKYETGIIANIPASKIKAMADRLSTTPAFLMGWNECEVPRHEPLQTNTPKYYLLDSEDRATVDGLIDTLLSKDKYKKAGTSAG